MTPFERVHMPSFAGATEWLNSEPLGPADLRGHVVLVNFWTLTCINWLRQEPYVRAWSEAYRDDGLVVIGVHTPEFSFEHDIELVRQATAAREIDYPVALDNDYEVWSAFVTASTEPTAYTLQGNHDVWLDRVGAGEKDIKRCGEDPPPTRLNCWTQQEEQIDERDRTERVWRWHLVQLPLDDLVALAIIGQGEQIVVGPASCRFG